MRFEVARLVGSIRVARIPDTIGLPVFQAGRSNSLCISETDHKLRITRFIEIDADSYLIDFDLPTQMAKKQFRIGDAVPIPYWSSGILQAINGDVNDVEGITSKISPEGGQLTIDIKNLLQKAEISDRMIPTSSAHQDLFEYNYADVLKGKIHNSKYYISLFALCSKAFSDLSTSDYKRRLENIIRTRFFEWVDNFGASGRFQNVSRMIEIASRFVLDESEAASIWSDVFGRRIHRTEDEFLLSGNTESIIRRYLPHGIHKQDRVFPFRGRRRQPSAKFDGLLNWFSEHAGQAESIEEFEYIWKVSIILFGISELPLELNETIERDCNSGISDLISQITSDVLNYKKSNQNLEFWDDRFDWYIRREHCLKCLRRIHNAKLRFSDVRDDQIAVLPDGVTVELDKISEMLQIVGLRYRKASMLGNRARIESWIAANAPKNFEEAYSLWNTSHGQSSNAYSVSTFKEKLYIRGWSEGHLILNNMEEIKMFRKIVNDYNPERDISWERAAKIRRDK